MGKAREFVLLAQAEKMKRDLRHLTGALRTEMEPKLSDEAAIHLMESAAILGANILRWRHGEPLATADQEQPEYPF